MPKRNLRIVRRGANIPVVGICEYCNAQFSADPTGRTVEGQPSVQEQVDAHKCKRRDASQNAVRIVTEATEDRFPQTHRNSLHGSPHAAHV
jgi:hypothetical protein